MGTSLLGRCFRSEVSSCIAWLYILWCLGLGEASNSSLVKVNKNPSSQRAGLLPLVSPSLSCQCPGSLQPFLCVPEHPLSWPQQRASAEMSRGSLEERKLWVQSGTFGKQQFLFSSPLLARGSNHPSPKSICACHQWNGSEAVPS